ncbi:hypothetical protein [Aquibacillus kalidii]|uniref:hypothetical protein n=1 Tax=Aquibacillus kalidii TaxID=2762597 RepID=UPI00164663BB|nr:hypothetical protein [Aquibacillus kalidii]
MNTVQLTELERFINEPVKVCIHGKEGEEQAPWVEKQVNSLTLCPDKTHLRIYFDSHYFFAVPLTSTVEQDETQWTAYDRAAGLFYAIKSEEK